MPRRKTALKPETNGHKPDTVPVEVVPDEVRVDASPVDAKPDDQTIDVPVDWKPADQFPVDSEPDKVDTTDYQLKTPEELEKEKKRKPPGFPFPDLLPDFDPDTGSWDLNPDINADPDPSPDTRKPDRTIPVAPNISGQHDAHAIKKYERLIRETKTGLTYTSPDGDKHEWKMRTNRRYRPSLW